MPKTYIPCYKLSEIFPVFLIDKIEKSGETDARNPLQVLAVSFRLNSLVARGMIFL